MNIGPVHQRFRNHGTLAFLAYGSGRSKLKVYSGTMPAAGAAVTTQVLLLVIQLDATPGVMVGDALHLSANTVGLILATGTPAWARLENGDGEWGGDLTASAPAAGGEVQLEVSTLGTLLMGGGSALVSAVIA